MDLVKIDDIVEHDVKLREAQTSKPEFAQLVDSIKNNGVLNAISVRKNGDGFELIDGCQRLAAAKQAGFDTIPVQVLDLTDEQVIVAQLHANAHKIETSPSQYTQQMLRIMEQDPTLTNSDMAAHCSMSTDWVKKRLSLGKIVDEDIQRLVDEGQIPLVSAYALARLPASEHSDFVESALNMEASEFIATADARGKEIREANRKGGAAAPAEFEAQARLRKRAELMEMVESPAPGIDVDTLKWALSMDDASVAEQKAKWDANQAQKAEAKKAREEKRAAAKAKKEADEASKEAPAAE